MDQELAVIHKLLSQNDYVNARDKLNNLQSRFPNLDNISGMLTVAEILSSAELDLPGYEIDWYWILRVLKTATESDIKTSFLKLTSLLTPLKNEFPGAESALKLISKAFSVLSDQEKRKIFDSNVAIALNDSQEPNINIKNELVLVVSETEEESFAVGQIWAVYDEEKLPRRYARINSIDQFGSCVNWLKSDPESIDEKRWCEVGLPVSCGIFRVQWDEFRVDEFEKFSHVISVIHRQSVSSDVVEIRPKRNEVWAIYRDWEPRKWCLNPQERKLSVLQMVEILSDVSSHEDDNVLVAELIKVEGETNHFIKCRDTKPFAIPSTHLFRFSHNVPVFKSTTINKDDTLFEVDRRAVPDIMNRDSLEPKRPKQVWAVCDGPDSLPREYVVVNEVISETEVSVTLLEPHLSTGNGRNLHLVCGSFKKSDITCSLDSSRLSHLVEFQKSRIANSFYMIYPKKGQVWAIYRDWNRWWKQSDFCMSKFENVEILTDWDDETVEIVSLVQVPGYLTFFRREISDDVRTTQTVSSTKMQCFSHRIVGFRIPRSDRFGVPEDSWHLEPNALPPHKKITKVEPVGS